MFILNISINFLVRLNSFFNGPTAIWIVQQKSLAFKSFAHNSYYGFHFNNIIHYLSVVKWLHNPPSSILDPTFLIYVYMITLDILMNIDITRIICY